MPKNLNEKYIYQSHLYKNYRHLNDRTVNMEKEVKSDLSGLDYDFSLKSKTTVEFF